MFERSRLNNNSTFVISQEYHEIPTRSIRARVNICLNFKPNNYKFVQNLYQDKSTMDMTLNENNLLNSNCWNKKYQPLTNDMTEDKKSGYFCLELNSLFVPDTNPL